MSAQVPDSAWLENINKVLADRGVEPSDRVSEALKAWLPESYDVFMLLLHPANTVIREWFEKNTKFGSLQAESFRLGVFFWDQSFWSLKVPMPQGFPQITQPYVLSCFADMPEYQKGLLQQNPKITETLCSHFVDEMNLFVSMQNVFTAKGCAAPDKLHGVGLLEAADLHYEAAAYLLSKPTPNPRIIETLRFVVELSLKALLACHHKITPEEVRDKKYSGQYGHDLLHMYDVVGQAGYSVMFQKSALSVFPPVAQRYEVKAVDLSNIWDAYQIALQTMSFAADKIESTLTH